MAMNNKCCPECNEPIPNGETYFVAPDEEGDYGAGGELFCFHPACWAHGECFGQLREHTKWLIGLVAASLKTLRTEYPPDDVPGCASDLMPELDQALNGLREEVDLLREQAKLAA
jgi:hypothetical protein